jgi:hypothetical protein
VFYDGHHEAEFAALCAQMQIKRLESAQWQ